MTRRDIVSITLGEEIGNHDNAFVSSAKVPEGKEAV